MFNCPITNKITLEESDIIIGQIYKKGKDNFLVLGIKDIKHKVKSFSKEDIQKYGEFRLETTLRMCVCKKTTELNSKKFYNILPSSFQYNHNQDSFNKILEISSENMSDIISALEENDNSFYFEKFISYDDQTEISFIFKDKNLNISLIDKDGNEVDNKNIKKIDFEHKFQLKNNKNKYSFIIIEK